MVTIGVGTLVRIYYDDEVFDEGEVIRIENDQIDVDFYDWISRWSSSAQFNLGDSFHDAKHFVTPNTEGIVICDFRTKQNNT